MITMKSVLAHRPSRSPARPSSVLERPITASVWPAVAQQPTPSQSTVVPRQHRGIDKAAAEDFDQARSSVDRDSTLRPRQPKIGVQTLRPIEREGRQRW